MRAGRSASLVLRGEAGAGKTVLLDYLAGRAVGAEVARAAGAEPEMEIAFSGLQQLCSPLLGRLDRLPAPQRDAVATAFGLSRGDPPEPLLLGLAVLGLLAEAAAERPLVCLVDDAQWIDRMSLVILSFVARRLDAEGVALIFACRTPGGEELLTGLSELAVEGLAVSDALALLDTVLPGPVDARVRDRIVTETRGNPLALIELPRGLSAAELAFGFGGQGERTVPGRVEEGFQRRVAALPADTRRLLLAAAVEPIGDVSLLWRALDLLGVRPDAVAAAETAGLIELRARVRFRHPLVRSAVWRAAQAVELRAVHAALAEVTDPVAEPERRAWHRAHAALGPDEQIVAELAGAADRALARGGRPAAAAFLERAAELTVDAGRRADLLVAAARYRMEAGALERVPELLAAAELNRPDPLVQAEIERMRANIAFMLHPGGAAGPPLLKAAGRLEALDPVAARFSYLMAMGVGVYAGRFGGDYLRQAAAASLAAPASEDFQGLFLTALAGWSLHGYAAAVPLLRRALSTPADGADFGFLFLAVPAAEEVYAADLADDFSDRALEFGRTFGATVVLFTALSCKAGRQLLAGRFADATAMLDEAQAVSQATAVPVPAGPVFALAAYRGREQAAVELLDAAVAEARGRDDGLRYAQAEYARAVLYNGLGRHNEALAAARSVVAHHDFSIYAPALSELVEAAVRTGEPALAADARLRLAERTTAAGTDWARGAQALADALIFGDEALYREAFARLSGLALPAARARLVYGEWLSRENRRRDARTELHAAHEAFTAMGAEGFADRAGRELSAMGDTVRKRSALQPTELSTQEARIARLVVSGQTNPQIGAELFLSPRTVEWHLRKIFTKLGVGTRRQLAGAMQDRRPVRFEEPLRNTDV